jgi:hypothetical protein
MNALFKLITLSALLALSSCGKDNESGRNSFARTCLQWVGNQCAQYSSYSISNLNSPYNFNGVSLNQVMTENPCVLGSMFGGMTNLQRSQVSIRVNINTVVPQGHMHVGVTSYGDVAAIIGDGSPNPLFVAYLCPRPVSGQGTLMPQILIGSYSTCRINPITAANMVFPDGTQANFRWPQGGSSVGRRFSFCF